MLTDLEQVTMSFFQLVVTVCIGLSLVIGRGACFPQSKVRATTPLDDYVNKPDSTYEYRDLGNSFKGDGYTSYFINMTSQTWLSRRSMHKVYIVTV